MQHIKRFFLFAVMAALLAVALPFPASAAGVALSSDKMWITGLTNGYEYITEQTYDAQNASTANNAYWTSLSGGKRPDGTKYAGFTLTQGNRLQVASAWYGQNVYFRERGTSGKGTVIAIPDYSQLPVQYKSNIRVLNVYSPDTKDSFYKHFITAITDGDGFLQGASDTGNIRVESVSVFSFNKVPDSYLTDAEGNYIYDLVCVGPCTDAEPDLSGAAAWALRRYIDEGYGFLVGHDTIYGYGGVNPAPNYTPDAGDTSTPVYELNTLNNGHWNMNWLMGVNKLYTEASPYDAASLILDLGNYTDKTTLYGDGKADSTTSQLKICAVTSGDPSTNVYARCPTNYPYSTFGDGGSITAGSTFFAGSTHTNQQIAYGKVWIDFYSNSQGGKLITDRNEGLAGTNNFYLTTNGNFGMMQIGHTKANLSGTWPDECRILANTLLYLSQRQPCEICQSEQDGNQDVHAVTRISSSVDLAKIGDPDFWFTYPIDGCYSLTADISLPDNWKPIADFRGHFSADGHTITLGANGAGVFEQSGTLGWNPTGWNLGTDPSKGNPSISGLLGKTTGVARCMGHLNQLFGTGSAEDYGGYTVEIVDAAGKTYRVKTNREGKYVIANLPCGDEKKLSAHVYTTDGTEVTAYGGIYAQIPLGAWNTCQTVPLHLFADQACPVENEMVYDEGDAVFRAKLNGSTLPTGVTWYYREGAGYSWKTVAASTSFFCTVSAPARIDAPEPYIESTMTAQGMLTEWDKFQFKAVFERDGMSYDSFDAKTEGYAGLLRVRDRPYTLGAVSDVVVWQGDSTTLSDTLEYYRTFDSGLTVFWQYRGNANCTWENVEGSEIVKSAELLNTYKNYGDINITGKGFLNQSVLHLDNVSSDIHGYQFRAVWRYTRRSKEFLSDTAAAPGKNGEVYVKISTAQCTQNPGNLTGNLTSGVVSGQYAYTAIFEYTANAPRAALRWQFKASAFAAYQEMDAFPWACTEISTTAPVPIGTDRYRVSSVLTLSNPPAEIDSDTEHYYFRAVFDNGYANAYSGSGDLTLHCSVDIDPGMPTTTVEADSSSRTYRYAALDVASAQGVRTWRVTFSSSTMNRASMSTTNALPAGVSVIGTNQGYSYSSPVAMTAAAVETFLRTVAVTIPNGQTADINWYVSFNYNPASYDPFSGCYYEYVDAANATWTQCYDAARSRYNSVLQANGHLAYIKSRTQQNLVHTLVGGRNAWIGGTNDSRYNQGYGDYRWLDGTYPYYSQLQNAASGTRYIRMTSSGAWEAVPNVNQTTVTLYDECNWGGWNVYQERVNHWGGEGEMPNGIYLLAPESNNGNNTIVFQDVPAVYGHQYWLFTQFGEYGDSNANMELNSPFGHWYSYWNTGSQCVINTVSTYTGLRSLGNGYARFDCATNGNGPSYSGVYGILAHLECVDLTQSFTAQGVDIPSADWLRYNVGIFSGSRTLNYTGNQSNANGYVVEYDVNDNTPTHTAQSASAVRTITGTPAAGDLTQNDLEIEYRADTDVIISCGVTALAPVNPDFPAQVTFDITAPDGSHTALTCTDLCMPGNGTQRAYVKYHVPDKTGALTVKVQPSASVWSDTRQINATVVDSKERTPPDPQYGDLAHTISNSPPSYPNVTMHTWHTYTCVKLDGRWEYTEHEHTARLICSLRLQPDRQAKTAIGNKLKSGYGFNVSLMAKVDTDSSDVLSAQDSMAYFPEWSYQTYWRRLELSTINERQQQFQFAVNPYSAAGHREHFIPLWYPDTTYRLFCTVRDCWTPVGELRQAVSNDLTVEGTVYDDWYIAETTP